MDNYYDDDVGDNNDDNDDDVGDYDDDNGNDTSAVRAMVTQVAGRAHSGQLSSWEKSIIVTIIVIVVAIILVIIIAYAIVVSVIQANCHVNHPRASIMHKWQRQTKTSIAWL